MADEVDFATQALKDRLRDDPRALFLLAQLNLAWVERFEARVAALERIAESGRHEAA